MSATNTIFDVFVIGGGINGVGIANDAAGRGLNVALCEMNDLASATSSASSKLIHGGLRYLEYYEFGLVKKALAEREVLLKNAPHIISPLVFRLPHQAHLRPAWMIRAGLFLYDNLSKRLTLPKSKGIKFKSTDPLKVEITKGFEYADAWVDDSRLTVLNALSAKSNGAKLFTQTKVLEAKSVNGIWHLKVLDRVTGETSQMHSKTLVNAAGPWVENITDNINSAESHGIRLVKGSHIVVPKIHHDQHAYILQNEDQRIVFVLPFEDDFSLIGTTDVDYQDDPQQAEISQDEIDYLVSITNSYFKHQISQQDIVHTFAGVRPLLHDEAEDAKAVTRDYTIELSTNGHAPLLNIYGGKITTYRTLAESAVDKLSTLFPNLKPAWTKNTTLPGGDFNSRSMLSAKLAEEFPWLPIALRQRYVRSYGSLCYRFLDGCYTQEDLGEHYGSGLYQKELCYLVQHEWAKSLDDVIWRRTKLGLRLSKQEKEKINQYLASKLTEHSYAQKCCA
ncbi:glycerol-3-phosphate dehydrogenase [Thalassotalea sp. M1531]|uniref:Glycerol-3-phosphate dehydrogenase n=1 Tax=Thalassotalea algicola TaxID=2716224 RepID=A0A7Y0Q5J9_9GAMM|nr:glycerol-3-phosphate dehydrogenase [Thalassotalea algicola]NMP30186.1 glycerol-3-phosphate dehydrogenase [Thalassotalea algicola]